ncbi:hypothetical protein BBJ29_004200 [Phytophthora kernoviae]|uniref:Uncharacterized protein n=1 Tax=Phytophthora kernoviae TaxID=325452 RepID=A0A3F2RTT8_9STRA|nr:hypothetical protein BBJ29_004200 [Phytophthora kernoviae]RLN64079.1 hypothetical protein BBP00_00003688 [Phytophthora kernoviae]
MSAWMRVADDSFVFSDFTSALPTDAVAVKSVPVRINMTQRFLRRNMATDWDLVKRDVLKSQILPTIATNRTLQRVVTKYQLMLSEIEAREGGSE